MYSSVLPTPVALGIRAAGQVSRSGSARFFHLLLPWRLSCAACSPGDSGRGLWPTMVPTTFYMPRHMRLLGWPVTGTWHLNPIGSGPGRESRGILDDASSTKREA